MHPKRNSTPHAKLAEALQKIPDSRIADVLLEGMSATSISRSGAVEPDSRTRIQAANLVIQYKVGRPCVSDGAPALPSDEEDETDVIEKLAQSPAMFRSIEKILEKSRALRDSKKAASFSADSSNPRAS